MTLCFSTSSMGTWRVGFDGGFLEGNAQPANSIDTSIAHVTQSLILTTVIYNIMARNPRQHGSAWTTPQVSADGVAVRQLTRGDLLTKVLLEGDRAVGVLRSQIPTAAKCAKYLAGQPDRHDRSLSARSSSARTCGPPKSGARPTGSSSARRANRSPTSPASTG